MNHNRTTIKNYQVLKLEQVETELSTFIKISSEILGCTLMTNSWYSPIKEVSKGRIMLFMLLSSKLLSGNSPNKFLIRGSHSF